MPAGQLLPFLRRLREKGGEGDRALLERFARQRDDEAFAALVRRHGPMVHAVCRRLLRHHHDADDAFQAVFLLLVRNAGSLQKPEQLGPWLHGVARRVALKARALGPRRREEPLTESPPVPADDGPVWRDLRPVLDDAIRSLPAKYRAAVVLCYLEGMTHAEAARHLGCPPGTLATRLSRARDQLRARLVRRGVTLSAAALAAVLTARAEASLPPALVGGVLRGLVSPSAISSYVTALTEGVCQAMFMEKLRFVVMGVVAAAALGALALRYRSSAGEPPALPPSAPPPVAVPARAGVKEPTAYPVIEYGMPVERTGLPEEGPLPGVARLRPDGKGVIIEAARTKMHYRMTALRERDGSRSQAGLRPITGHTRIEVDLPLSEVQAYRLDGTAIDAKKLAELLKKEAPVLVTPDRSAVHKRWAQVVRDDTLVIEVKATELMEKKEPPAGAPLPASGAR